MVAAGRVPVSAVSSGYAAIATVAGAWAQELDTLYTGDVDVLSCDLISLLSQSTWENRSWSPSAAGATIPSTYQIQCAAIVAIVAAGETYFAGQGITPPPIGGGGGAPVQIGADQIVDTFTLTDTADSPVIVPRDAGGAPVEVVIDTVTPGNYLLVRFVVGASNGGGVTDVSALFYPVVAFNNAPVYPTNFNKISNAGNGGLVPHVQSATGYATFTAEVLVLIPEGSTKATVELVAETSGGDLGIGGTASSGSFKTGLTLEAQEIPAAQVTQLSPSFLIPLGG